MPANNSALFDRFAQLIDAETAVDGAPLAPLERALIRAGLAASLPALDPVAAQAAIAEALAVGGTPTQIQEVISVVAGLGVHSLMMTARLLVQESTRAGFDLGGALTADEQALWDKYVGDDPFWAEMEAELPGFLPAMLRLSPAQFTAFFTFCAVPWKTRTVSARVKEMLALASDAMPAHRFFPGFRLHLRNAVKLGAGRVALKQCLELAIAAPVHSGVE